MLPLGPVKRLTSLVLLALALPLGVMHAAAGPSAPANLPTIKILVAKDGWYRVTKQTLDNLGFTPTNPEHVQLTLGGPPTFSAAVPFQLRDGALEFYGQGLDTPYTDTRVYWLRQGTAPGQRMAFARARGAASPPSGTFPATVELRDRTNYNASLVNGPGNNFFGSFVRSTTGPVSRQLVVPNVDTSQNATLRVDLQGFCLDVNTCSSIQHSVNVSVNGTPLAGAVTGSGANAMTQTFTVPGGTLVEGTNTVTLSTTDPAESISYTDRLVLTYQHLYEVDPGGLVFPVTPGQNVSVGEFSSSGVRVADVTNPAAPRELFPTIGGGPPHTIGLTAPADANRLYAFTDAHVLSPKQVLADTPSSLHAASAADLIVISHASFASAAQPLVDLRRNEGLRVAVVDIQDVFDEFSDGAKDVAGITAFLQHAKNSWTPPAPKYVLLVGDGTYDPRGYTSAGASDFIPTRFVHAQFAPEPASDDSLADFNGDGTPELAVGRLPVNTASETSALVSKIVNYATQAPKKTALLVADNFDRLDYDFVGFSNDLKSSSLDPNAVAVTQVNRPPGGGGDAATRDQVVAEASKGPTMVNWFGHGSTQAWAGSPPLLRYHPTNATLDDVRKLTNAGALSLYLMMTCQNGYFVNPTFPSLAEGLLRSANGAVAVWASTGDTVPYDQVDAAKIATNILFSDPTKRLGDAMLSAKSDPAVTDIDVKHTWVLLGDPTTKLRIQ